MELPKPLAYCVRMMTDEGINHTYLMWMPAAGALEAMPLFTAEQVAELLTEAWGQGREGENDYLTMDFRAAYCKQEKST